MPPKTEMIETYLELARKRASKKGISLAQAQAEILFAHPRLYECYLRERADAGAAGTGSAAKYAQLSADLNAR
jgi:hypothetical protein